MKYIVISDIHLGHDKTPSEHISKNLSKYVLNPSNSDLDVIFIAGDLFDKLLDLNNYSVNSILQFIHELLNYCSKNNILLRILEGTPSHDWQQSKLIIKINELLEKPVDVKYFCALDIEYIPRIQKCVLYIPDEWSHDHTAIERQIQDKLKDNNISTVDIAILHGQFTYQLKSGMSNHFHYKEDYFLSIVKGFIHIGHYHTHTNFSRIIANGSFDRLAHGEEEDKGYVKVVDSTWSFITNQNSYIYKTINVTPKVDIQSLDKKIYKLPKYSYVRLVIPDDHPLYHQVDQLKVRYSDYHIKKTTKKDISEDNNVTYIISDTPLITPTEYINESNIFSILKDRVLTTIQDNSIKDIALEYISKFSIEKME